MLDHSIELDHQTIRCVCIQTLKKQRSSLTQEDYLIDLRTSQEVEKSDFDLKALSEKEISHTRIPVTSITLSEQDVDKIRGEFRRHPKKTSWLISQGGQRACALIFLHQARNQNWSLEKLDELFPQVQEDRDLYSWIQAYLERHQIGLENKD